VSRRRDVDVSRLPSAVIDSRSLVWLGTLVMTAIETTVFAIAVAAYFYLRMRAVEWPPARIGPPALAVPTINLLVLLVSVLPAIVLDRASRRKNVRVIRIALAANLLFGLVFLILRVFELKALHCWWNSNVYGSITWTILGLHTSNLLTSLLETGIVLAWFLFKPVEDRHFLDSRLDGVFWYFIVLTWIPLYLVVFVTPRLH
jgi:cytochrome c oxidase subunit 1/cytochrome c oxidase subunit I+III